MFAMTNPKELREETYLEQKIYPVQLFANRCSRVNPGDCVLYLHWHEHMEIILMRRGRAVFHIDSRPYEAGAEEIILIPGGSLHVGYALDEGDVDFDCIVLNPSLFNPWMHDPVHNQMIVPYLEGRRHFPVKPEDPRRRDQSRVWLEEAVEELSARPQGYQLVVTSKLHLYFTLLARAGMEEGPEKPAHAAYFPNREPFKRLIRRIEEHPGEAWSVEGASRFLNLTPFYFCRLFKQLTGRTFVEYIHVCRMNEARRLLQESGMSVTEIAARVGCGNANYFTRLYKRYIGMTPSQTRKQGGPTAEVSLTLEGDRED